MRIIYQRRLAAVFLLLLSISPLILLYLNNVPDEVRGVENVRSIYQGQAAARRKMLAAYKWNDTYKTLYNVLVPEVFCPSLARLGQVGDGGKWICLPRKLLPSPCTIYSLGINGDISFDSHIQEVTGFVCQLHAFDKFKQTDEILTRLGQINGDFHRAAIGKFSDLKKGEYSIADLLSIHSNVPMIDLLKVDIEGAEFQVMIDFVDQVELICQVSIEMHGSAYQHVELLKTMAAAGFLLISYEINGSFHELCEYTMLHISCLRRYDAGPILGQYLL